MIRKGDDVTTDWRMGREVGLIHNIYIRSHDGLLGTYVWTMYKYVQNAVHWYEYVDTCGGRR